MKSSILQKNRPFLMIPRHKNITKEEILMKKKKTISGTFRRCPFLLSLLFLAFFLIGSLDFLPPLPSAWAAKDLPTSFDLSTAIVKVAQKTIPAVVHIEITASQEVANPLFPFQNDPFFHYFFNQPKKMPRKFKRELRGLGTGMIMDAKGHILTNHHVVGGAEKIVVTLADGNQYPAKIVGTDPKTDLAVIQISAKEPLPFVTFGDSDKMDVGEWVVAIGHPRGLDQTVTQGIISAKHRQGIVDPSSYQDFLQTDAAINPGNSGGPLLNLQGEVIGVNAVIASESGGFEGIGFAIPSKMALHIAKELMDHGKVERGWLGVSVQNITPEQAKSAGLDSPKGARVVDVVKGGPAEKAAIKKDDILIAYQGKEIRDAGELRNEIATATIGQTAKVTVLRGKEKKEIAVKIGNLEDATKLLASVIRDRLGVTVQPMTNKDVEKYGLESHQGVVITRVEPKGPLGEAGFEVNDIILGINGQPVAGLESFIMMVSSLKPHQKVALMALDHRSGNTGAVEVTVR